MRKKKADPRAHLLESELVIGGGRYETLLMIVKPPARFL
jgi:hypothetical protein